MVDLYALLDRGNCLLNEYKIEFPKENHWNYSTFIKGSVAGAIIAVAGLIFAQLSVLIVGSFVAGGNAIAALITKQRIESHLIEMFRLVIDRFDKPRTPRNIPLNPFEKLGEKEEKIKELTLEIDSLKERLAKYQT